MSKQIRDQGVGMSLRSVGLDPLRALRSLCAGDVTLHRAALAGRVACAREEQPLLP